MKGCSSWAIGIFLVALVVTFIYKFFFIILGAILFFWGIYMYGKDQENKVERKLPWIITGAGLISAILGIVFLFVGGDEPTLNPNNDKVASVTVSEKPEDTNAKPEKTTTVKSDDEKQVAAPKDESEGNNKNDIKSDDSSEQKQTTDKKQTTTTAPKTVNAPKDAVPGTMIRVVDGDTMHVRINGKNETVRLLLVDTPETEHPSKPDEPFGPKAHQYADKMLAPGTKVYIEYDGPKRGKYDRLLAYLWVDGKDFNKLLLRKGLARYAYVYDPPYTHSNEFQQAQSYAKSHHLGIWSISGYVTSSGYNIPYSCKWAKQHGYDTNGCHFSDPKPEPEPKPKSDDNQNDKSSETLKSDYDCGDFDTHDEAQNFYEAHNPDQDPYDLDGNDDDGIVCESLP